MSNCKEAMHFEFSFLSISHFTLSSHHHDFNCFYLLMQIITFYNNVYIEYQKYCTYYVKNLFVYALNRPMSIMNMCFMLDTFVQWSLICLRLLTIFFFFEINRLWSLASLMAIQCDHIFFIFGYLILQYININY